MQIQTFDGLVLAVFCLAVFGLLALLGEFLRRKRFIEGELARKFVHISTGTWAALWPVFIDLPSIAVLAAFLTVLAIILRLFAPLRSVYSIRRLSIGEILIGMGLTITALIASSGSVFSTAVLIIAWSDALAALFGLKFGKKSSLKIFGAKKSFIGSATFFVSSLVFVLGFLMYEANFTFVVESSEIIRLIVISSGVASLLTVTEAFGGYGLDNLTIPVLAAFLLNLA